MKKLLVAIVVFAGGCGEAPVRREPDTRTLFERRLAYHRDSRTGLCFALYFPLTTGGLSGIATVDCAPVESLLVKE